MNSIARVLGVMSWLVLALAACRTEPPVLTDYLMSSSSDGSGSSEGMVSVDSSSGGGTEGSAGSGDSGGESVCGDGVVEGDEDCDDRGESMTCNADCMPSTCGDGVMNATANEDCDAGGESPTCDDDCTMVFCGDGTVNTAAGEGCDDGGESADCNVDCTVAFCGDDMFNAAAGEECDDGDGNTLAVAAVIEDSNATGIDGDQANNIASQSGAVYVYARDGMGVWSQQAYVKASNTGTNDYFGYSVALSGDGNILAVGARQEDSNATGIDGDQASNTAGSSGAVYLY